MIENIVNVNPEEANIPTASVLRRTNYFGLERSMLVWVGKNKYIIYRRGRAVLAIFETKEKYTASIRPPKRWAPYIYLDPVYTVLDSHGHDIEFGLFAMIFTLATVSMISCYQII